ncbi:MAG: gliding motility-associated C-terminal domain-containing protein [Sphingobacteriia bacterium]|jgi:gliding motility-associated-like protein|nr:gliding motility-associated C-terminal domain-containing protein [Paludibacteraceae bacterium]NCA79379.1 gliding motility-associated C-terminal domain-containing protein [Sphingobacteriia bacterium]
MKKVAAILFLICFCAFSQAQFIVSPAGSCLMQDVDGLDKLFLFKSIDISTEITYTGTEAETEIKWTLFDGTEYASGTKSIAPDDATGYILVINDVPTYWIWAIDYSKYPLTMNSLSVVEADDKCDYIKLLIDWNVPELTYKDKNKNTHSLKRNFTVTYTDKEWSSDAWNTKDVNFSKSAPFTELPIAAPYCDTQFFLSGDQFATEMGLKIDSLYTPIYKAIAVKSYPKGEIAERNIKNEVERKGSDGTSGSAPLVVDFTSNANEPVANFYEWFIYKTETPTDYIRYTDRNLRYTFSESGSYRVRLKVSSDGCNTTDSLNIKVLESSLTVPNVFTPNGDGINDEFRVAYKSLLTYHCWVYNRWGRLLFKSDDAGKGWDGTVNGQMSAAGAYYYIIEATGSDKDTDGNPIVYKLSGDINLLRGK